jgi:hypothetical protein
MLSARDVRHVMMTRDDNLGMEMRTFASQYEGSDEEFDDPGSLRVRTNRRQYQIYFKWLHNFITLKLVKLCQML